MFSYPKPLWRSFLPVWAFGALLGLAACENDLESIKKIANMNSGKAIDTTRGVDVIYSDSAVVKGRLLTPLLIKYSVEKPYDVMPDGVKIFVFDKQGKESATIVADSAVQLEQENLSKFYKNVIVTTSDGSVFKSDELIWDQPQKKFYTNGTFVMTKPNGDILQGIRFRSADNLDYAEWENSTGEMEAPENVAQ